MTTMSTVTFSPLYRQIRDRLVHSLQAGEWRPGEAIPSEIDLAARYGVSQGTVRKAIDALSAENLLVRRQGRGTFVASHQEARAQIRFLRLRTDDGGDCQSTLTQAPKEAVRRDFMAEGHGGGRGRHRRC
jgi:GntR family transcriptional regulator